MVHAGFDKPSDAIYAIVFNSNHEAASLGLTKFSSGEIGKFTAFLES
jgi:hypothetical protein